jgi:hypothetical protein
VPKDFPSERVGVVALRNGAPSVVEYSGEFIVVSLIVMFIVVSLIVIVMMLIVISFYLLLFL